MEPRKLSSDDEIWSQGDEELAEVLRQLRLDPLALWLCIGFGEADNAWQVPPQPLSEAPARYRLN